MKYKFMMSCGRGAEREVAEPSKYYQIDRDYYGKQGLCDKCWKDLHEQVRKRQEDERGF